MSDGESVSDVTPLLDAIVGRGLEDRPASTPRRVLDGPTWSALHTAITHERVTGHLVAAIDSGALPATTAQCEEALESHERALAADLVLERLLLGSVEMLDGAGIPVRVLKGAAVAHTVYPRPDLRSFGDVDLLVPGEHFDAAVGRLERDGSRRRYAEPRPGFDRRFGKGVCMERPDGLEVDLHRSFVAGPLGLTIRLETLFAEPGMAFELGGRTLHGLAPAPQFLHACYHAALGHDPPRRATLRDIAQIVLHTDLDPDAVRDLVTGWRCAAVVRRAVEQTWRTFALASVPPLVAWTRDLAPARAERRALDAYLGPDRSYARQVAAGLRAVPGWRDRAAYARALLLPDRSYLSDRDRTYRERFRRAARLVRRARPASPERAGR